MRVLITQPAQDAAATAAVLRARGHAVVIAPLLAAERLPEPKINLTAAQGFVVTGGEGARALADNIGVRTFPVFTDSEATAALLTSLGFKQVLIAKDDTADLARLVERTVKPSHGALIHACHNGPATNLGALLGNMGFALRPLPLYSLKRASALPAEITAGLRDKAFDAVLFLSAEEARAFVALVQLAKLDGAVASITAVAASPVVAAPLRALKFKGVSVPGGGTLEDAAMQLDGALVDKVEEQRAASEQRAREEADRERAAETQRQAEVAAREADAAHKRATEEQARAEREAKAAAEREAKERERAAREQAAKEAAERKRIAEEQARAEREAKATAEREAKERERAAREHTAKEDAERKRIAEEQARAEREAKREQQRLEDEARATAQREADEKARIAREQAAKEDAERRRIAEEQARAEREAKREQQRLEDEARAAAKREADEKARATALPEAAKGDGEQNLKPQASGGGLRIWLKSRFVTPSGEATTPQRPSWAVIQEAAVERGPAAPPQEQPPLRGSPDPDPDIHVTPPLPATETAPRSDIVEPMSSEPTASLPPDDAETPGPTPIRSAESLRGGRAARLLAEDAADDKARGQRFRNYSFGDGGETAAESDRPDVPPAAAAPRRRSRAPLLFLLLVLLTAGAYFTAPAWLPKFGRAPELAITQAPPAKTEDVAALTARLHALEEKAAAPRPAAPAVAPAATPPLAGDDALANQGRLVAALTARIATLETAIGNAARLDELNKRLSTLEGKSADAATVLSLTERVNALENAGRSAAGSQAVAVAYVMALGQWQNAVAAGRPFALELETTKAIAARAGASLDDSAFAAYAATGLPTLPNLRGRFDAAAAAAVRAAAVPDNTAGWLRRILDRVMALATIRRVDGSAEGASAWAIAARAESRMMQNDLPGAVAEMEGLRGAAAEAAAFWTGPAKARLAAEHTLADSITKAVASVAAAGDKPSN